MHYLLEINDLKEVWPTDAKLEIISGIACFIMAIIIIINIFNGVEV